MEELIITHIKYSVTKEKKFYNSNNKSVKMDTEKRNKKGYKISNKSSISF